MRRCPICERDSIIGHGRRRQQAHDEHHDWIGIRRGRCPGCGKTFTFLPLLSLPYTHYSLLARCHALRRRSAEHCSWEEATPTLKDPNRVPDPAAVLEKAAAFYQQQLDHYAEARRYLKQRGLYDPAAVQALRIGYAPGGSLRRHLIAQGYSCDLLRRLGLINARGCDAFYRRVIFPCCQGGQVIHLYGRSITAAVAHRFLPGSKGGLYAWEWVQQCPEVILVEGLFDYAVLWQAGFRHVTCSFGTHLSTHQFQPLCDRPRTVYLTFDVDTNGSGQQASQRLAHQLQAQGIAACRVLLPEGHDPNSFFVQGGDAGQFQTLLEAARP